MKEYKLNSAINLTVPNTADTVNVQHEWGQVLISNAPATGTYSFTSDSIGTHSFIFSIGNLDADLQGAIVQNLQADVISNYLTSSEFFGDYPSLDVGDNSDKFVRNERKLRKFINSYTNQVFGPYLNKSRVIQGDGGNSLLLPTRMNRLASVIDNFGNDLTEFVEIAPLAPEFIHRKPKEFIAYTVRPQSMLYDVDVKHDVTRDTREFFSDSLNYTVVGDWGWPWVPVAISEATKLLMSDEYTGALDAFRRGIVNRALDDFSEAYGPGNFDYSTGNSEVDYLLSDFIGINIGLA